MAAPRNENIREKILSAAEDLLASEKMSDISLADIAKEAGVSKGTLYYYYKNKNDLIFDITDKYLEPAASGSSHMDRRRLKRYFHAPAHKICIAKRC